MIRRLLREPLLHFALLGAAIFGAYRLTAPPVSDASEIVIYVRDEMLYRENLALGLDRGRSRRS